MKTNLYMNGAAFLDSFEIRWGNQFLLFFRQSLQDCSKKNLAHRKYKVVQKQYYTVKYGDTLSGIAQKYRTSVSNIKKWNGLRSDRIMTGQKLKIWTKA